MIDPYNALREYLKRLTYNVIINNSILKQIELFDDWIKTKEYEPIQAGSLFYKLAFLSLNRLIVIELCKLLLENEQRSLIDWLKKAKEHSKSIKPKELQQVNHGKLVKKVLSEDQYRNLIDAHFSKINEHNDLIEKLRALRNKSYTHSDKKYFEDQEKISIDYPIKFQELSLLLNTISEIIRKHYSLCNASAGNG